MVDQGLDRHRLDAAAVPEPADLPIDWNRFGDRTPDVPTPFEDEGLDHGGEPVDAPASRWGSADVRSELLPADAELDDRRTRVDLTSLHPDRLEAARPDQQREFDRAYRADPSPETIARGINPGYYSDDPEARRGRMLNCADCARAFQEGLEGKPRVAARIDSRGLPSADRDRALGEHQVYLEQWAGARGEPMSYAEVERRVRDQRGSAILFGYGPDSGHAFNAYWDADRATVRWADGQVGDTGDWGTGDHQIRWPQVEAIVFDRGGRPA